MSSTTSEFDNGDIDDLLERCCVSAEQVRASLANLEKARVSSRTLLAKQCEQLRQDIEYATENKLAEIRKSSSALIDEVKSYEERCLHEIDVYEERLRDASSLYDAWATEQVRADTDSLEGFLERANDELLKLNECLAQIEQLHSKSLKFKASSASRIGSLKFESNKIKKLRELDEYDLVCTHAKTNTSMITHFERLGDGSYFAIAYETSVPPGRNVFLLFDENGALLSSVANKTEYQTTISACAAHANSVVLCAYSLGVRALNVVSIEGVRMEIRRQATTDCFFKSACADDSHVYCLNYDDAVYVFDWTLALVTCMVTRDASSAPPPCLSIRDAGTSQLVVADGMYLIKTRDEVRFIEASSGRLLKTVMLPVSGATFLVNSRSELVVLSTRDHTIYGYDYDGKCLFENELCDSVYEWHQCSFYPMTLKLTDNDQMYLVDYRGFKLYK